MFAGPGTKPALQPGLGNQLQRRRIDAHAIRRQQARDQGCAGGAGVAIEREAQETLHQPTARGAVRAAERDLAQRLILTAQTLCSVSSRATSKFSLDPTIAFPPDCGGRSCLVELQAPAAKIENPGMDAHVAGSSACADFVAVAERAGGSDDVHGFQTQRLNCKSCGLVVVCFRRYPALLGDDGAVLPVES